MPLYEYQCGACGNRFERIQKFSDPPVELCPSCGELKVVKLLSSPAIMFKGSGFYINDYARKGAGAPEGAKSDDAPKGATSDSKTSSSDSKSSSSDSKTSESKSSPDSKSTSSESSGTSSSSGPTSSAPATPSSKDS